MNKLYELCIGNLDRQYMDSDFTFGMDSIGDSLIENTTYLFELWEYPDRKTFIKFAPMCGRLILEQSLAIILGRFDPIRFLSLVRGAESPDFVLGQQNASSFNWKRDVFPDVKPPQAGWWSQETISKNIFRSMLNGHLSDYLFETAHAALITDLTDFTADSSVLPDWISELLKAETGESVLGRIRLKAKESYSSLSKGIHFEFLKGNSTSLPLIGVFESISDAMTVAATVGLYSHYVDIALQKLDRGQALANFIYLVEKFDATNYKDALNG